MTSPKKPMFSALTLLNIWNVAIPKSAEKKAELALAGGDFSQVWRLLASTHQRKELTFYHVQRKLAAHMASCDSSAFDALLDDFKSNHHPGALVGFLNAVHVAVHDLEPQVWQFNPKTPLSLADQAAFDAANFDKSKSMLILSLEACAKNWALCDEHHPRSQREHQIGKPRIVKADGHFFEPITTNINDPLDLAMEKWIELSERTELASDHAAVARIAKSLPETFVQELRRHSTRTIAEGMLRAGRSSCFARHI